MGYGSITFPTCNKHCSDGNSNTPGWGTHWLYIADFDGKRYRKSPRFVPFPLLSFSQFLQERTTTADPCTLLLRHRYHSYFPPPSPLPSNLIHSSLHMHNPTYILHDLAVRTLQNILKMVLLTGLSNLYDSLTSSLKALICHVEMKRGRSSSWVWQ